jgi:hypothetical protein
MSTKTVFARVSVELAPIATELAVETEALVPSAVLLTAIHGCAPIEDAQA